MIIKNQFITALASTLFIIALSFNHISSVYAEDSKLPSIDKQVQKYNQQSKNNKNAPKITKQDMQIMGDAAKELKQTLPNPGLAAGSPAPDFELPNADGKPIRLYDELKKGPVILVFYRGAWCPYCNIQLHAYQKSYSQFQQYNAQIIAITPQQPDKSLQQIKKDKFPFEILSDLDDVVIKTYNLYFKVPEKLHKLYKERFGLDIEKFNGKGRLGLPVPGTYVIDTNGIIIAAYAELDYKKRMEPVDILNALKSIK